jgi:transposase InsO family protein
MGRLREDARANRAVPVAFLVQHESTATHPEVNRKRVERLMREAGIQGIYRRRGRRNLANQATEEDLVRRQFTVAAPGPPVAD